MPSANWPSANMAGWVTADTGVSLCRVPAVKHSAKIFYFFKKFLCRGSLARPSAKIPFAEGQARPLVNFFLFFEPCFFCAIIHYLKLNFKIWVNFDFFWYISLIYFFSLIFFEYFKFELQLDGIMQFSDSKNVIHGILCMLSPYPRTRIKFRASSSRNMMRNLSEKCF